MARITGFKKEDYERILEDKKHNRLSFPLSVSHSSVKADGADVSFVTTFQSAEELLKVLDKALGNDV